MLFIGIKLCTRAEENMQRNYYSDWALETFENCVVDLPLVDFAHLGQDFSMSDLPPSYDSCVLEPQPPSYLDLYHS